MNKKSGFTLTEVMITMGVIGVISALTVPTLLNNYQRKALSLQLRKTVNDFTSAADLMMTEEGKARFSATTGYNNLDNFVTGHFKVLKTCAANNSGCFAAENYRSIDGESSAAFSCAGNSYILASSAAVCLSLSDDGNVNVTTDTNGPEGPNIAGRDLFMFALRGDDGTADFVGTVANCVTSTTGTGCYELLASENNWVMEY